MPFAKNYQIRPKTCVACNATFGTTVGLARFCPDCRAARVAPSETTDAARARMASLRMRKARR